MSESFLPHNRGNHKTLLIAAKLKNKNCICSKQIELACIIHKNLKKTVILQIIILLQFFHIKTEFFKFLPKAHYNFAVLFVANLSQY